ncbi:MAG TPA: heterodisulfide reductase-related iron-sulfur binding cluster [Polyangiaceae bacterium]|nr:heterodisulfide reductase-related iron-sulfur binding cluster [Polyangiaceae bacterium]
MSVIPRAPARPPATSPNDERYYDARDLEAELRRTFQVCHECRMCVGFCGSFPSLFKRIDKAIEAGKAVGAEAINDEDIKAVSDECWQCKLCYIKCPYTADEGAYELLDYPRLMARERAARTARDGLPIVDRVLGEPQALGALSSGPLAPAVNLIQASRLLRKVQEKVTGISADFPLPPAAKQPFSAWFDDHTPSEKAGQAGDVVLFATCYGEHNTPEVAQAAVRVLEHNGFRVHVPGAGSAPTGSALTCCGMPNLDGGDVASFVDKVKHNVDQLFPLVMEGKRVVVLGPTCGYTMKREWPEYLQTPESAEVAAATIDLMELFVKLGREKKLNRDFKKGLGTVAYHAACHLRAQKIGIPGSRVLGVVPNTDVRVVEHCSAVDGTWGMKAQNYLKGRKYALRLVRGIEELDPDVVVSDCSLAGLRVVHENAVRVIHPAQALAEVYGLIEEAPGLKAVAPRPR